MATEYYQVASSQGPLSIEASSTLNSSSVLTSSGSFPVSNNQLSASVVTPSSDPWLANSANLKTLSLNDWGASPLKKSNQVPSLFEPDDIEARSWANIVPQQTPEVLKASFELKNSYEMRNPHHNLRGSSQINRSGQASKLDAWSHIDPSVSIHSPALVSLKTSSTHASPALRNSNMLKRSTASNQDDDEMSLQRYKTELCKTFIETGICRYGVKCQFAHGKEELRPVLRHPKYKTEICKTFHNTGTCPYGIRCRFIHTRTKEEHQVFSSSASSFVDSDFEIDEDDDNKVAAPPGIPVPQWSKSWTPTASPVVKSVNKFPSKRLSQQIPIQQIPI